MNAFGRHRRYVSLHPLMRHDERAIQILDNVLANARQCRPFAVVDGLRDTAFMYFKIANVTR